MSKSIPKDLTSYDFLKMFAVLLMIVDHVGYYFFPDDMWWRVAGRLCVPMWFFLIGYARSRDLGPKLWIGALVLAAFNPVAGIPIFPLNILATMICIRLLIDPVMDHARKNPSYLWALGVIMVLLALPTNGFSEYGTLGLLVALFGYLMRHRDEELWKPLEKHVDPFLAFILVGFLVIQLLTFGFSGAQLQVFVVEMVIVFGVLYFFKPQTYPRLTEKMPGPVAGIIRLFGRRTLEIYVLHLMLFKVLGMFLDPVRFPLFQFHLFPQW
ncbi:MAG: hypothetical protein H6868_09495 [Rhodospirillales bacterium]|nr:hypothetical protein [Rhodospirillales bacterium]